MNIFEEAYKIANKDRSTELMSSMHKPSYYDGLLQGALEMADVMKQQILQLLDDRMTSNLANEGNSAGGRYYSARMEEDVDIITEIKKL